jgi:hypothetical protein
LPIDRVLGYVASFEGARIMQSLKEAPNPALEPTAASGLRRLAVPSSLRSSAAAQRER